MRKIISTLFLFSLFLVPFCDASVFWKKEKPVLFLTSYDPRAHLNYDEKIEPMNVFKVGERIYFSVYTKKGFKSDYIKYQVVSQNDNAHVGGYSRVTNKTVRVSNKNSYVDYIVLSRPGKYFIQIFDIENLQQWIVMGAFAVLNE